MGRPLLLLVLTAAVQVAAAIRMGMFPEVVDYSFTDCRQEMLEMVTTGGLLEKELDEAGKANFKKLWQGNVCDHLIPGGTAEHVTALQSFAVNENFQKAFNKALNNAIGVSTYQDRFPFKSMFFLISDAMELLKPENCSTVYSGTEMEYEANIGETVRLKTFFPAKMELADVTEDAELSEEMGTVFMITSCSAISLEGKLCVSSEIDFLISPNELFTIEDVKTVKTSNNHYREIKLKHSGFKSFSNCSGLERAEESKGSSSGVLGFCSNLTLSLIMVCFFILAL